MGFLPACLTKTAYYFYCYCVTIAYYLSPCLVKKQEIGKILSSLDDTIITQEKLNENSIQAYHDRTAKIEGTMQWRSKEWQVQHPDQYMPFEQRYRLWFLHKVLAREQRNLAPTIKLVLRQKEDTIKTIVQKLMYIDLPAIIVKDIMEYTYPSTYQCQYYFLETHYTRLSKLVRISYDYTPFITLLTCSLLFFQVYYLKRYSSAIIAKKQFRKQPSRSHGPRRQMVYDHYLKIVKELGEEVCYQLSRCGSLNMHTMTTENNTPLEKALIAQNNTAIQLAIANPFFYSIQLNDKEDYLFIPFLDSWKVNEKVIVPLTITNFCEELFFAYDRLVEHIRGNTETKLQHSVNNMIKAMENREILTWNAHVFLAAIPFLHFFRRRATNQSFVTRNKVIHNMPLGLWVSGLLCLVFIEIFGE